MGTGQTNMEVLPHFQEEIGRSEKKWSSALQSGLEGQGNSK